MNTIVVRDASKKFGEHTIFHGVNVTFRQGEITGIVGRNGSGKTVLFKTILGFLRLTSGMIKVRGELVGEDIDIVQGVGTIIEEPGFMPQLSGIDNLRILASLKAEITLEQIRQVMTLVGLDPDSQKRVSQYSMGMRQRLGIAQAIMEDPDILILDEPMSGLDSSGVELIRRLLQDLRDSGKTIILASHSQEDIDILCNHVYRIEDGELSKER